MRIPSPLFNCQQATLLVERRADEVLPFPIRVQLWAHLRPCPPYRRYEAQSRFIARYAPLADVPTPDPCPTRDRPLPAAAAAGRPGFKIPLSRLRPPARF